MSSPVHNWHLQMQGNRVQVKVYKTYQSAAKPGDAATRGAVCGMSQRSRKRLMDYFASVDWQGQKVIFITLTYPREFPTGKEAKKHLKAFLERVRRRFPRASGFWRLEFQKRGAPHFHLLFFNLPFWDKEEVQAAWCDVIGVEQVFTRIEQIKSWKRAMYYVSKYVAKRTDVDADGGFNYIPYLHAGRVWGFFQKALIPFAETVNAVFKGVGKDFYDFRRYCKRFYRGVMRGNALSGFTIYRAGHETIKRLAVPSTISDNKRDGWHEDRIADKLRRKTILYGMVNALTV